MLKSIDSARISKIICRLQKRAQDVYADHTSFFFMAGAFDSDQRIQSDMSPMAILVRYYARRNNIALTPEGMQLAAISANELLRVYENLIAMVLDLQVRKKISSLNPGILRLDAFSTEAWMVESRLITLPEDLELLAAQKNHIVDFFLQAAQSRPSRLYANGVEFADYRSVPTVASMYEWAYTLQATPGEYALLLINGNDPSVEGASYLFESRPST